MNAEPGTGIPDEETFEDEHVALSLEDILGMLRRRLWLIVLLGLIGLGLSLGYSLVQTPQYEASIKLLIGQAQGRDEGSSSLMSEVQGLQSLTMTMAEAVDSRPVAEAVIRELDLPTSPGPLLENLDAEQIPETQYIEVTYRDTDPERTRRVVEAVGDEFSQQIADVSLSANNVTATVWERPATPNSPVSPQPLRNALLGFVLGATLGVTAAFLLEFFSQKAVGYRYKK